MTRSVLVIGAGPAGLAAAVCLARRGIPFTLVERGATVAASLRRVDPDMRLLTPTPLSRLPRMARDRSDPSYLSFAELAERLDRYARGHGVAVRTGAEVVSVRRGEGGFVARLGGGETLAATHVVSCTGIIATQSFPPDFDPARTRIRWRHSLDVRAGDVRAARRLLVVGAGASAAEVLETWLGVRARGDAAWLSARRRVVAVPHRILGVDVHYLVRPLESLRPWIFGLRPAQFPEPMLGRAVLRALRRGDILRAGAVAAWEEDAVRLASGERLRPDLLVFATGFRYDTRHLADLVEHDADGWPRVRACESRAAPGLFLLGLRFGRTFASAYLRGIGPDAEHVARRIARS